jgi:hypothetical protein
VRIGRAVLPEAAHDGHFGAIPTWLGIAAATAAMLPALNCLQRGQVGIVKLYLLLLGFRLLMRCRGALGATAAGMVFALPITLKIIPLVPVALVAGQRLVVAWYARAKAAWSQAGGLALGLAAGLALCLFVVPGALVGWQANSRHLGVWWNSVAARAESTSEDNFAGDSTTVRNQSLTNAVHRFGNWAHYYFAGGPHDDLSMNQRRAAPPLLMDTPLVDSVLMAARVGIACLAVAVSFRMARAQDTLGLAAAFGQACVATLLLFSIARGHYYVMLFPAVALVGLWLLREGRVKTAVAMALVPCLLSIGHYAFLYSAGRVGWLGLTTTLWYLAASALLLGPHRRAAQAVLAPSEPAPAHVERPLAA